MDEQKAESAVAWLTFHGYDPIKETCKRYRQGFYTSEEFILMLAAAVEVKITICPS